MFRNSKTSEGRNRDEEGREEEEAEKNKGRELEERKIEWEEGKEGEIEKEKETEREKEKREEELEIPSPTQETVRPKVRGVIKPCRPSTPNNSSNIIETNITKTVNAKGKVSRRLRSLVQDHRDLPM